MTFSTYEEFKAEESSSKVTLAMLEGSKRLVGWEVESGSVFKLTSFDVAIIQSIEDSGTAYTEVFSLAAVTSSTFFNDRDADILYLEASDSSDPNTRFLVLNRKFFFSTHGASLAFDLSAGEEVFWEPLLLSTSAFGVQLDNRNQLGVAIEGSGNLTFINDADSPDTGSFWRNNYTTVFFENHNVEVYSWNENLPATEAKLIFKGRVKSKTYNRKRVTFQVQDLLSELRGEVELTDISEIAGVKVSEDLLTAKQRRIYGRVFGNAPTNIDQVVEDVGYVLTGTVSATNGSATVTGTGTLFLKEISPEDTLLINNIEVEVGSVETDLSLTLSETFAGNTGGSLPFAIFPDKTKPYINRVFKVAGHATREPTTTVSNATSLNFIELVSTTDLRVGDVLFFGASGTGQAATIQRISGNLVKLEENLIAAPTVGTAVVRPSIQNVRINNKLLIFDRDYTYDSSTSVCTLDELAEFNAAPIRDLTGTITFTDTTRTVTGTGSNFDTQLQVGMWIRADGEAEFFEILSIVSPTSLLLRTPATYSNTGGAGYKPVVNFTPGTDVLSLDVIGITKDGTKDGAFIENGSEIVKHLVEDAGITDLDTASFTESEDLAQAPLGLVIPDAFADQTTDTFRSYINRVNRSIFGSLIQNNTFQLQYNILSPKREITITQLREVDILNFTVDTTNEFMAKLVVIEYKIKEHNPATGESSINTSQDASQVAEFILKTTRTKRIQTLLAFAEESVIFARRWRFLLEIGQTVMKIKTKMQGMDLQVNDRLEILHEKLYERIGGGKRKISAIQGIKKSGDIVEIETEDLADAFGKCSTVTENTASNFANSSLDEKIVQGYITDNNGMISNTEETFRLHRIW